jgi:CRISPR/Cas system-associated endonuclease Cas1
LTGDETLATTSLVTPRSALREQLRVNRGATHPVNAMLNYAYGVLMARTQVQNIWGRFQS